MTDSHRPGAHVTPEGVRYCIWAPKLDSIKVAVYGEEGVRHLNMKKEQYGFHTALDSAGRAGDRYGYMLESGDVFPDPASRGQAEDVHGLSLVIDSSQYRWTDRDWKRPGFRDLIIYELHIGTFTPEGTFRAAISKLPELKDLGVNAIEIMPIGDFPGSRNWGYDGVLIYAPETTYGTPDELRALVDAAHHHGIAVILDIVYNHFGPDGNYVSVYSPFYFHERHHTPWGNGFNFDAEHNAPVRDFFRQNPIYWMEEFHMDGFRFDAAHQIQDDSGKHILAELTEVIHARGGYAIAEDERNEARVITPTKEGGLGFDAVWADDFHHTARVSLTAENYSYFSDFAGTLDQIICTLKEGWYYHGQHSAFAQKPRGTAATHLPPERFVHCITNHDQVGNRAMGERLNHLVEPDAYRAISLLLCLSPYTPMLFMGQEWGATTPFLFFTDHNEDLGRKVTEGRRKEFSAFPEFADQEKQLQIPDPQSLATFEKSKLDWSEASRAGHAKLRELYRLALDLRVKHPAFRPTDRSSWNVKAVSQSAGCLFLRDPDYQFLVLFDLTGKAVEPPIQTEDWEFVLSSQELRFGGPGRNFVPGERLDLQRPETIVLRRLNKEKISTEKYTRKETHGR